MRWTMLALLGAAAAAACGLVTGANPDYCDMDNPCDGAGRMYCDTTGDYNADGRRNRCVPWPFEGNTLCETSADCDEDPGEPICELGSAGVCRPCNDGATGDEECAAKDPTRPLCENGRCVAGCEMSSECPIDTPICDDSVCATCVEGATGDADCTMRDDTLPRCGPDGACVECLTGGDCQAAAAPVCDSKTFMCRGCRDHDECGSGVCDIPTGMCVAETAIIFVDPSGGTDDSTCGSKASPCKTLMDSNGALDKVDSAKQTIWLGAGQYNESVEVTGGETVTLVGEADTDGSPAANVVPPATSDRPGLQVTNSSSVRVDRLALTNASGGNNADGIRCSSAEVTVFRSIVGPNQATGIQASDCTVTVERSMIKRNLGGGISLTDTEFTVVNNFIVENGDAISSNFGGVRISNVGGITTQEFDFNTVARNVAALGSNGVDCTTVEDMTGSNSIIWGVTSTPPAITGNCSWIFSDIRGGAVGEGNIDQDPMFADTSGGDYHIEMGSPARDVADENTAVADDVDGEARPQPSGGRADIGADEYHPPPGA